MALCKPFPSHGHSLVIESASQCFINKVAERMAGTDGLCLLQISTVLVEASVSQLFEHASGYSAQFTRLLCFQTEHCELITHQHASFLLSFRQCHTHHQGLILRPARLEDHVVFSPSRGKYISGCPFTKYINSCKAKRICRHQFGGCRTKIDQNRRNFRFFLRAMMQWVTIRGTRLGLKYIYPS